MAFYVDEEEVWKCPKHPSKRRRSGICPVCLRDRLVTLCPDCANVRPCSCCGPATTSSSSSSSSSFSRFSSDGVGAVGRVSNLIESEPAFRRSRSLAIPFLRSRSRFVGTETEPNSQKETPAIGRSKASSFWSVFRSQKSKRDEGKEGHVKSKVEAEKLEDETVRKKTMMMRSRSVAVSSGGSGVVGVVEGRSKGRSWYFPSPIKAFRQSKISKVVHEQSPLYRV